MAQTKGRGVDLESIESPDGRSLLLTNAKGSGDTVPVLGFGDGAGSRARGQLDTSVVVVGFGGT